MDERGGIEAERRIVRTFEEWVSALGDRVEVLESNGDTQAVRMVAAEDTTITIKIRNGQVCCHRTYTPPGPEICLDHGCC